MARDEFSSKTRQALALRSHYRCNFPRCTQITVGPSDEGPEAVARIGIAAHIHAAAPGGRRYMASMTKEQRSHIGNGIWMCPTHAAMIDQDDAQYTADVLRGWRVVAESLVRIELISGISAQAAGVPSDLLALGPEVVATGEVVACAGSRWDLRLDHFVAGDVHAVTSMSESFQQLPRYDRYIVSNALGDGRVIAKGPAWRKVDTGYLVELEVEPRFPRIRVQELGRDFAIEKTGDLVFRNGDFESVSGIDALPQKIALCLWHQRGRSPFFDNFGSRIAEYCSTFSESPWLRYRKKLWIQGVRKAAYPSG